MDSWASKVLRFRSFMLQAGPHCSFLPVPVSTLGGWDPEAHPAILSIVSGIAFRAMVEFSWANSIVFQRHATVL